MINKIALFPNTSFSPSQTLAEMMSTIDTVSAVICFTVTKDGDIVMHAGGICTPGAQAIMALLMSDHALKRAREQD